MGRPFGYSDEELQFIKDNHKMLRTELHAQFQEKFNREVTLAALNSVCKRNGWYSGRRTKGGSHYAPEVVRFISDNRKKPRKELLALVNEKFGISMTLIGISNFCSRHEFKSGRKGHFGDREGWSQIVQFKTQPIGYETKPDKRGRVYVKVGMPNGYRLKHHVIWEQHFGLIPENHVIVFKDGDDTNFNPSNLIAVHRGAIGTLNRRYKPQQADKEIKPLLLTMAQIDHKIYQKENANA